MRLLNLTEGETKMNDLKPCPFCGSKIAPDIVKRIQNYVCWYVVRCYLCKGGCGLEVGSYENDTPEKAASAWNRRVSDNTIGIQQTAEGITFTATGEYDEAVKTGMMLGGSYAINAINYKLMKEKILTPEIFEILNKVKKEILEDEGEQDE